MKDLTKGNEALVILLFAVPMLIGNVFQQLYVVVDSIVVGQFLGKQALAAVGACFPIIFLLISLVMGLTMGASVVISQYFGAKNIPMVKKTIDTTYITLFVMSVLMTIIGPLISGPILKLMDTPQEIFSQALIFINIFFYGSILLFGYNTAGSILRALGDSKTPTWFLLFSTIVNIILVLLFVLVFHWGIAGSSLATLFAQGVSFFGLVLYVNRLENDVLHLKPWKMVFDVEIFKSIIRIGLPSGLQQMFVALGMMAIIRVVNGFGTDVIAGFTAASRLDAFAMMPAMNLSMAISTFVGQNIGANKIERVKKGLLATILMATVFSVSISLIVIFWGQPIMTVFTHDPKVLSYGDSYLHIAGAFYILFAIMFVLSGLFRGAGDTIMPMFLTIMSLWLIRIPAARILSQHFGSDGIWWSFVIGWGFGLILSVAYYFTGIWKRFKVVKQPA